MVSVLPPPWCGFACFGKQWRWFCHIILGEMPLLKAYDMTRQNKIYPRGRGIWHQLFPPCVKNEIWHENRRKCQPVPGTSDPPTLRLNSDWCIIQWPILARTAKKVIIIKTSPQVKWDAGPEGFLPLTAVWLVSGSWRVVLESEIWPK